MKISSLLHIAASLFLVATINTGTAVADEHVTFSLQEKDKPTPNRRLQQRRPIGMVIVRSRNTLQETTDSLLDDLEDGSPQFRVFSNIDLSGTFSGTGTVPPNRIIIFGISKLDSPIMQRDLLAGLDLPHKILIWEPSPGQVFVGYNAVNYLSARYPRVRRAFKFLKFVGRVQLNLVSRATGISRNRILRHKFAPVRSLLSPRQGVTTVRSDADFETTWDRLLDIVSRISTIVAMVDHSENSRGVLSRPLPNSRLLLFGNPPLIGNIPTLGIEMPVKILVTERRPGVVQVSTNAISFLAEERHGIPPIIIRNPQRNIDRFVEFAATGMTMDEGGE